MENEVTVKISNKIMLTTSTAPLCFLIFIDVVSVGDESINNPTPFFL
jgi:hypothetical protein